MIKDENNIEMKDDSLIPFSYIKAAINKTFKKITKNSQTNDNNIYLKKINQIIIKDIGNIINYLITIEYLYKCIYKQNSNLYNLLRRNINYISKLSLNRRNKMFKELKINNFELLLAIFIINLKYTINERNHQKTKELLLIIIRLIAENIFPRNFFTIITEIFINILIMILNNNSDYKYSLNDEPFTLINDIIESLIIYPKEIKIEDTNNYILTDIIDIFDKYLITPNYSNIYFRETSIWLKFLENRMINPIKENEIINNNDDNNNEDEKSNKDEDDNIKDNIKKKLYFFLIKIYKFNMRDEYFQKNIMKKGIINLNYSINILNYLMHLFNEEEKLQIDSSFKIINGFYLLKDNFLFLPNLKLSKIYEFSLIFSFKITQIPKDSESVNILNIYNKLNKSILNVSVDKNNYLTILYNGDKKWNTYIKIQENKFYLVCFSQPKKFIGNSKLSLFINESRNEDLIRDDKGKGQEIQEADSCFYYKNKTSSLELSKEFSLELGKTNFIGIIGEFLIINKNFDKENIHHLFNLKEHYSRVLSQIYNGYENLNSCDSINWKKSKYGINKINSKEKESISFFKKFGYEIKLEIMTYKINRFTKSKYFSQYYYTQEMFRNSSIKPTNEKKENSEKNISLISFLPMKSGNGSLNSSIYSYANNNSLSNSNSFATSSFIYQKDSYRSEKIDISLNSFKLRYSSVVFYQNKGIDFLTLQLHNIISIIEDQKLLDIYLYEIINFVYKIMIIMNEDIIDSSVRQCPKLDNKISIFFLSLLTLLNKKRENIILNHNIILKLIEILDYFRFNQLFAQRNMILSILLDVKYYENKSDIMKYPKLLKTITSDLIDDSNNDVTIMNNEILYKILMLDFVFELKEYKHKILIKLISSFIAFDKFKQNNNNEIDIISEFINYFQGLKSEVKIYHYLKVIYLNLDKIKKKLITNEAFLENVNRGMEKININHCKYCCYNQILCYLIYEETYIIPSSDNNYSFNYNPIGFMKNPSILFLKCIFIQCFSITNENKLKYIKSKLDGIQFILSVIKNNNNKKNTKDLDNKLLEVIGYKKFIPRFKAIVEYIKFLFKEQTESNDDKLLNKIKDSVNIIMSFLKQICSERKIYLKNSEYNKNKHNWSIINSDNINNYINESEKKVKEYKLMQKYDEFINEFLCSKGIRTFYYIYLSINYKYAIEDINDFISISIKNIFNPFYFYYFTPNLNFDNDINKEYISNNDENKNINDFIKSQIFNLIGTELTKSKLIFEEQQDIEIVQNNILILIYIYQNIINNKIQISIEFEKNIILFLNFLLDNYFINCKYVFDINTILDNNSKNTSNKKFLLEMIIDIFFTLYDNRNYDLKYQYLIKEAFTNRKLNLLKIDEQYFLETKNKGPCFTFFNQSFLQKICKGVEVPEILYTIYFLYYLCEKLNKYKNNTENKDNTEPIKMIKDIMLSLFIYAIQIYNSNFQKIIYVRKNIINKYPYKIYKSFMQFIEVKYKEKSPTLDKLIEYYDKLIVKKDINLERSTYFFNEELLTKNSVLDISINNNKSIIMHSTNTWKQSPRIKIVKNSINKIEDNNLGKPSLFKKSKGIEFFNKISDKIIAKKRPKSFEQKTKLNKILNYNNNTIKSSKNVDKILQKLPFLESESENNSDNNSLNNTLDLNLKENESIKIDDQNNINKLKDKNIIIIKENKNNENNEKLINFSEKNKIKEKEYNLIFKDKIKDDISDMSEEEVIIEEYDINKKLKNINIPSKFYRYLFHLSDPNTLKILFNPKEYYFWNKFTLVLKDIIFHHKKFGLLTKIYNIKFNKYNIEKSFKNKNNNNYYLKFPTKLKNFVCDDYYRPFIKPDINFFKHKLLPKSHPYLNKNIFNNNYTDEDNLCKIKFERILPINYDLRPTKRIVCELINNSGSIYGHIYFNHAFLIFISDSNSDPRSEQLSKNFNDDKEEFYLYSYFLEERIKSKKKYIIMYFSEIKEIFIRRFCLIYLGYEIFMKDNRTHLFNFFNRNNLKKFLQIMSEKLELSYKRNNPNNIPIYSHNENILSLSVLNYNINNDISFSVINDPLIVFEKNGFKFKYQKGEISNFKYLLLLNKFSSRTYKDNSQYLVFPLLFMDLEKKIKRDLSKVICLNKKKGENNENIFKDNFNSYGNHFNTHYSTSAYVLYYLVRLNPFTFGHIKLQSGKFDTPERIYSSLNNYLSAICSSNENRELCPELFSLYEAFINLNHNKIGYIKSDNIFINDFDSNDQNGIVENIITMRQALERANIIPWIDNIFGSNQLNESEDLINIFPLSSYEQKNNFEEDKKKYEKEGKSKKEIIELIKNNISLLGVGITPVQIFKTNHPLRNTGSKRLYSFFDNGANNNINSEKVVKSLPKKNLANFINLNMVNKYQIFSISNENNNFGMKLMIKSKRNISILKMYGNENNNKNNNSIIKLDLWKKKQIKIEPYSKMCCELSPGIFCFCRYIDNVIHIKSEKQSFLYQYKCIITSLEFFSYNEKRNSNNNIIVYTNEILFGDEQGNLNLLQIEYESSNKKQTIQIDSDKIKIIKEVKAHDSFIQGILYVKRLNIIISYSEEGQITINNAFSFNIINIIELGDKYFIKNIKISDYDLMYIYCTNNINKKEYIKCYTLNGTNATKLKTEKKINNYFVTEQLIVIYQNNLIEIFNLYDLSSKATYAINPDMKIDKKADKKGNQTEGENNIVFCDLIIKDMKIIIIYQDHNIIIQDIFT